MCGKIVFGEISITAADDTACSQSEVMYSASNFGE